MTTTGCGDEYIWSSVNTAHDPLGFFPHFISLRTKPQFGLFSSKWGHLCSNFTVYVANVNLLRLRGTACVFQRIKAAQSEGILFYRGEHYWCNRDSAFPFRQIGTVPSLLLFSQDCLDKRGDMIACEQRQALIFSLRPKNNFTVA